MVGLIKRWVYSTIGVRSKYGQNTLSTVRVRYGTETI